MEIINSENRKSIRKEEGKQKLTEDLRLLSDLIVAVYLIGQEWMAFGLRCVFIYIYPLNPL